MLDWTTILQPTYAAPDKYHRVSFASFSSRLHQKEEEVVTTFGSVQGVDERDCGKLYRMTQTRSDAWLIHYDESRSEASIFPEIHFPRASADQLLHGYFQASSLNLNYL